MHGGSRRHAEGTQRPFITASYGAEEDVQLADGSNTSAATVQMQQGMDAMMQDMVHSHQTKETELSSVNSKYF